MSGLRFSKSKDRQPLKETEGKPLLTSGDLKSSDLHLSENRAGEQQTKSINFTTSLMGKMSSNSQLITQRGEIHKKVEEKLNRYFPDEEDSEDEQVVGRINTQNLIGFDDQSTQEFDNSKNRKMMELKQALDLKSQMSSIEDRR